MAPNGQNISPQSDHVHRHCRRPTYHKTLHPVNSETVFTRVIPASDTVWYRVMPASVVFAVATCPSVTLVYCIQMAED